MKTIFVNGCFDVLHPGHIELFKYAKYLGDYLIVAIDSDDRVSEMKGSNRPIFSQLDRVKILESIRHINDIYIFNSDKELELIIKKINPDIMVVGSDWKGKKIVGCQYAKEIKFFDRIGEYSTSKTIQGFTYR